MIAPPAIGQPLSVGQTIELCNTLLGDIELVVEGEIASYNVNQGKYVFFDIKDEELDARLNCFMMLYKQNIPLENGMRVKITCRPGIHQKYGKFSLTVSRVEPKGEGSLKRAFELLKLKLEKEGLFSDVRKRSLPLLPQTVGVISSEDAAGFGDFMRIAKERLPGVQFVLANVSVQGTEAEQDICTAFDYLNGHYELDAIVLTRGGGSIEDLHAFNSESVARAIVRSKAPVLVGVGHERDVTIADFCADVRAATPSNAAQLLLPTSDEVLARVERSVLQGRRLAERAIAEVFERVTGTSLRLHQRITTHIASTRQFIEQLVKTIDATSPQSTLERGYTLTWGPDGKCVRSKDQVKKGDTLTTQFAHDKVTSTVS